MPTKAETAREACRVLREAIADIERIERRLGSELQSSRELSLAVTKLDEAVLWLDRRRLLVIAAAAREGEPADA